MPDFSEFVRGHPVFLLYAEKPAADFGLVV